MKLYRCDYCSKDLPEDFSYIEVRTQQEVPTISSYPSPKQFCSALCVAEYHAKQCGREVVIVTPA